MLFNSLEFIFIFLPLTFVVYFFVLKYRLKTWAINWLVLTSLFYYGWWKFSFLSVILASMFFNFYLGQLIGKSKKNIFLVTGVLINLLALGYFKYADFFIANINWLFNSQLSLLNVALPLGISFFTFQQISFLVDSARGETHDYQLQHYFLFVTFFPQNIAGPIVHHKEMMPQFDINENAKINWDNVARGVSYFVLGLSKKVFIADTFAEWASMGFNEQSVLNTHGAWITALSYTFQLYFDFSGYTDMAFGGAKLFNIDLPLNFNSPYKAINIQDFWRRWHMTLSRFLRDYLYIPLGGNRGSSLKTYRNLILTFVLGGFWHGASWMFIIWGALHGLGLCFYRLTQNKKIKINKYIGQLMTFVFVVIAWVFFRASHIKEAINILSGMFSFHLNDPNSFLITDKMIFWNIFGYIICLKFPNSNELVLKMKFNILEVFILAWLSIVSLYYLQVNGYTEFLYRFF
jgi:alginate O-acetyltransferase complex protein AlgI